MDDLNRFNTPMQPSPLGQQEPVSPQPAMPQAPVGVTAQAGYPSLGGPLQDPITQPVQTPVMQNTPVSFIPQNPQPAPVMPQPELVMNQPVQYQTPMQTQPMQAPSSFAPLPSPVFQMPQAQMPQQPIQQQMPQTPVMPQAPQARPETVVTPPFPDLSGLQLGTTPGVPVEPAVNQTPPQPVVMQAPPVQEPKEVPFPDITATQQIGTSFHATEQKNNPYVLLQNKANPTKTKENKDEVYMYKPRNTRLPKTILMGIVAFGILAFAFLVIKVFAGFLIGSQHVKVTLTYWGIQEPYSVMAPIIATFEQQNPDITVNYIQQDGTDYATTVKTRIENGTGPDIFRYHETWLPELLPDLLPLSNDVISRNDFTSAYYPVIQNDLIKNGALYGIPMDMDTLSLFINQKLFSANNAQVPTTWDEFLTTAKALTTRDSSGKIQIAGAALGTMNNVTNAPDIVSLLMIQNGVDLNSMTPAANANDALTFYTSFVTSSGNVWDGTLDPSLLAFEEGKLAMYIGYSWDELSIQTTSPNLQYAVYPVPHLPGRNTTVASYWAEGISSKTKHPQESLLFMHYLAQENTLTALYTTEAKYRPFGEPYPRVDLQSSLKNLPNVYPFVSQANDAYSSIFESPIGNAAINTQMNTYLTNAVNGILSGTPQQNTISTLSTGVTQVLSKYGQF